MSLLLLAILLGATMTVLGLLLIAVTIGIHRQEHAASLGHRPASLSAALARRVLGLHAPRPFDPPHRTEDAHHAKETTP